MAEQPTKSKIVKFNPKLVSHRQQVIVTCASLATELIKPGQKSRVNWLKACKDMGWVPKNATRVKALILLTEMGRTGFGYVPSGTVRRGMAVKSQRKEKVAA